jgi:hypothetical protein
MRRVFLSFLGIGSKKGEDKFEYDPARYYVVEGVPSHETRFVQAAELQLLGASSFDEIVIVTTEKAKNLHYRELKSELQKLGAPSIKCVLVTEDMSSKGQWAWFEEILKHIDPEDTLTVDLTHGYRAIPIIFSTAIHFLQRAKRVSLERVLYGAFDKNRKLSPIIDMKDFYLINEWAEGVSRLVDDADARKLADLPKETQEFQAGELNDPDLLFSLDELTNRIRNVDMHTVGAVATQTLSLIRAKEKGASAVGQILLRLVREKYGSLADESSSSGRYDRAYFTGQLAFIQLLLVHRLYMQAFTTMREVVGSIGLIENPKANTRSANGKKQRWKADVFINMLQHDEDKWGFKDDAEKARQKLMPFYEKLKHCGLEVILRNFLKELLSYRNDFDHGWTNPKASREDIPEKGRHFFTELSKTISELRNCGLLE